MSRLPFELLLALRYLRPKRTFVSIITLISVMGVTLGVAVLIIVISVMSGFDRELRDKVFGFNAHLTILQRDTGGRMTNAAVVMQLVNSNRFVKGSSPLVMNQVVVQTEPEVGQRRIAAPFLRGIDPLAQTSLGLVTSNIIDGTNDLTGRGILLGNDLADRLFTSVGDRVLVATPEDLEKMWDAKTNNAKEVPLPE